MDFLPQVIGGSESEEEHEEAVKLAKDDLNEEDVFDNKPVEKLQMKVVKEEPQPEPEPVQEVIHEVIEKPKEKKPRKKRVLTEAQKQKLAEARVKALEVRRANARKKQEIKDLKKQKQDQELNKLRNDVKPIEKKPEPKPHQNIIIKEKESDSKKYYSPINANGTKEKKVMFTQDDVDMITFKAISNYDEIRKQRKKEKQKRKEEENIKERERQKLLRIVNPSTKQYDASTDPFANCY
tara:strand:+ start:1453 stop:2166 length:714 start_codon:yes stop_codon:yes gene_type:complete